jgi:hypothetical protein
LNINTYDNLLCTIGYALVHIVARNASGSGVAITLVLASPTQTAADGPASAGSVTSSAGRPATAEGQVIPCSLPRQSGGAVASGQGHGAACDPVSSLQAEMFGRRLSLLFQQVSMASLIDGDISSVVVSHFLEGC